MHQAERRPDLVHTEIESGPSALAEPPQLISRDSAAEIRFAETLA